jgi:hypothetical protein
MAWSRSTLVLQPQIVMSPGLWLLVAGSGRFGLGAGRGVLRADHQAIDQLGQFVADLISEAGKEPMISRGLTGKPWFIFTQMLAEAAHTRSPEEIPDRV